MYVYRDPSTPPASAPISSPRRPAADDAAYWYDQLAEDPGPGREETRGPFEPLLPSGPSEAGQQRTPAARGTGQAPPVAGQERQESREGQEAPELTRARKLEQLKDLYLTAEAIGEQNVDKHFDQLLAQQRELISEYFKQSPAAGPEVAGTQAGTRPDAPQAGAVGGPAGPPDDASVRAEPPRTW